MKTKNNLTTGILLGIGVIVLPLVLMSTTYTTNKQKTFEVHMVEQGDRLKPVEGYLLNSETGDVWYIKGSTKTECK
jgi:hypothetical protein|tara:strand:- start:312 stop:539 length:228 start_codon:yes stop_codon:yes gene_type:complete